MTKEFKTIPEVRKFVIDNKIINPYLRIGRRQLEVEPIILLEYQNNSLHQYLLKLNRYSRKGVKLSANKNKG